MTKNRPDEVQRQYVTVRDVGGVRVLAKLVAVVHGHLGPDKKAPASLIITDFRFASLGPGRRFKSASINYRFESMTPGDRGTSASHRGIFVVNIAPKGYFSIEPSTKTIPIKAAVSSAADLPVQVGVTASTTWDLTESAQTAGRATLAGTRNRRTAGWSLMEDNKQKTGIPKYFRTAILLRRENYDRFQATVDIETSTDIKSSVAKLFGQIPKDDPIIFDPSTDYMGDFTNIAKDHLHDEKLMDFIILAGTGTESSSDHENSNVIYHIRLES
jgi:hypothetical protein